jgi:hypothetical protein
MSCPPSTQTKIDSPYGRQGGGGGKENRSCTVIQLQLCLCSCSEVTLKLYLQLQCSYFRMFAKVFWDMELCILLHRYEHFGEMSEPNYWITWHHKPEDCNLEIHRHHNLKSHCTLSFISHIRNRRSSGRMRPSTSFDPALICFSEFSRIHGGRKHGVFY